jgi:8-amino-7-oxononanoate synthase
LIVSEGVFSMEGDLADMPGLVAKAKPYGARIYVSETDGLGVLGPTGAGASDQMGVLDEVDLVMGTFSKALASQGGFIAGPHNVINYLKHTARPFVFSASLPPAAVATAGAALEVIKEEPERRQRVLDIANRLRRELRSRGFTVLDGITPIVPVVVPYEDVLCRLCIALLDDGIYVNPLLRPAASQNLLRISCSATHTYSQVDRLVRKLMRLSKSLDCGLTDGIGQLQPIEALDPSEPYGRGASRP